MVHEKPTTFERWLALEDITLGDASAKHAACTQCGQKASELSFYGMLDHAYCTPCLKYSYGFDQAMFLTAELAIGGAIKACIESEVPEVIVRAAVAKAFDDLHDAEVDWWRSRGRSAA